MRSFIFTTISLALLSSTALAHDHKGGIIVKPAKTISAPFDIVHAKISTEGNVATFHMAVSGKAGTSKPTPSGKFAGANVFSYVWPTSIDPYEVGFDHDAGILALAVTAHPDFDDTPLFDENEDKNRTNDGGLWHMHWVVLGPDDACGKGALKVKDIAANIKPRLPKTWPGVPLLLDSPGWQPSLTGETVEVSVPFDDIGIVTKATFDGVTAGLRINDSAHTPLLCVANVFKIASGNLSLPGKPNQ
jgi:hypothetical protein